MTGVQTCALPIYQLTELLDNSEDARRMLRDTLRGAGKLNSRTEPESSTNEAVPATSKHGAAETGQSDPGLRPQTREEVLAALRGEYSSPAVEKANSGSDSSVADTESEPPICCCLYSDLSPVFVT